MANWRLTHGVTTQDLKDWGFSEDLSLNRINQGIDKCTVRLPGPADAAGLFAYSDLITILRPDGTKYFSGRFIGARATGEAEESVDYEFAGPWWDLENITFQQSWQVFAGWTTPGDPTTPPTFLPAKSSECFLGQKADGTLQTTSEQITEALTWAISCGANLQIGTIDAGVQIPIYNIRDLTCAEVIVQMGRWTPDKVGWFDYSLTPPKFHFRKLANLTNKTVTVGTDKTKRVRLKPRYDLQLPAVVLRFKQIDDVDGIAWVEFTTQKYPALATENAIGVPIHTIELQGMKMTRVFASLVTATVNANSGTTATKIAWWQGKEKTLASDKVDITGSGFGISNVAVVDEDTGAAVSLATYPRELSDGQIAPWMGFLSKRVVITALATYAVYADAGHHVLIGKRTKELSVKVTVTNATTGSFSAVQHYESAESIPSGLAQAIYDAHSVLQYEGEVALVGDEMPADLGVGNKVTVAGTDQTWANILVQESLEEPCNGRITVRLGPAQHLGIADLIELLRVNRYRWVFNMPSSRATGEASGEAQVTLGDKTPKENTVVGNGVLATLATAAASGSDTKKVTSNCDSSSHEIIIEKVVTATGVRVASSEAIEVKISDISASSGKVAKFRKVYFKDPYNSCAKMMMWALCTAPETDTDH